MMVSFVLSFFPRDVLDEILNLIESVSEDFPSYSFRPVMILPPILTFPSCSYRTSDIILSSKMLKRVVERRHPCLTPTVVLNHYPVLPFI